MCICVYVRENQYAKSSREFDIHLSPLLLFGVTNSASRVEGPPDGVDQRIVVFDYLGAQLSLVRTEPLCKIDGTCRGSACAE